MINNFTQPLIITIIVIALLLIAFLSASYRPNKPVNKLMNKYFYNFSKFMEITTDINVASQAQISIHYTDEGDKGNPVILLLHGAFSSLHTFDEWVQHLIKAGYRVIRIDLPNHGLTGPWSDNMNSEPRSVDAIKKLLDYLGINQCFIAGNSMGGAIAYHFASQYHNKNDFKVNGLILIDAMYPVKDTDTINSKTGKNLIIDSRNYLFSNIASKFTPKFLFKLALGKVYGSKSTLNNETVSRYYDMLLREGNRKAFVLHAIHKNFNHDISGIDKLEAINNYKIPTLVMWGKEDMVIDIKNAYLFKDTLGLSNDNIKIYDGIGHVPMEEASETTVADLLNFLSKINP